jgi:hypothetical protein
MARAVTSRLQAQAGPGPQCPEAQADGVPCATLGLDCEVCGRRTTDTPPGSARCRDCEPAEPAPVVPHA